MKTWRLMVWWLALFLARQAMAAQPSLVTLVTNGLLEPYGAVVDSGNNVYLSDNSHRIFKYVYDNGNLTVLAGQQGQTGTNNGPGFLSRFYSPKGLALFAGGLVVADSGNHALRFVSLTGNAVERVTPFAGVPSPNLVGANTDTRVSAAEARFNTPLGLTTNGADLFVADSKNSAIRRVYFEPTTGGYMVQRLTVTFVDPAQPFFEPSDIVVGGDGFLYVSDTRNQSIRQLIRQPDGTYAAFCLAGSVQQVAGTNDAFFARDARFNLPVGLCWLGGATGLLIADNGNHTLRNAFIDADLTAFFGTNVWRVATYAGSPKQPGLIDGYLDTARLKSPTQIVRDNDGGLLVVDSGNNALRRIQIEAVQPPVTTPTIGYITYVTNKDGTVVTQLAGFTDATFYSDVVLAILGETGTMTYTYGPTPGLNQTDTIPVPKAGYGEAPLPYADGMPKKDTPASIIDFEPDVTIKAVGAAPDRRPSPVVQARVRFKVASPIIEGNNPASLTVSDTTPEAKLYYTLDDIGDATELPAASRIEAENGVAFRLPITTDVTIKVQASRPGWQTSEIVRKDISPVNFAANRISLGFASGEASSAFVGSPGQHFYAPITLTLLPNQSIYSLQFNLRLASIDPGFPILSPNIDFETKLEKPDPDHPGTFLSIPPVVFIATNTNNWYQSFSNLVTTDAGLTQGSFDDLGWSADSSLLMVGWLERLGSTNLYNTKIQDLVTYSRTHNSQYLSSGGKVVLGAWGFTVPANAPPNTRYLLQIGRPSATADGITADCFIDAPTNGPVGLGTDINAIKHLVIGSTNYLVGDTVPFRWFNAGDFGDSNLMNGDVMDLFQRVAYGLNSPPDNSDMWDAMDSASSHVPLTDPTDAIDHALIDSMTFGDGVLDVADIYVTYWRSLDPTLKWYIRWRDTTGLHAAAVPNTFRGVRADLPARKTPIHEADLPADVSTIRQSTAPPSVRFVAGDRQAQAGQTVTIPIQARIAGPLPVRVLLLNLDVVPCNGAPPLLEPVQFQPAAGLSAPEFSDSTGAGNVARVWLDTAKAGVWGNSPVGTLTLKIPSQAPTTACYRVVFTKVSASPNGLGVFPQTVQSGLVSLGDLSLSSWGDSIPDAWRLRYFGNLTDPRSQPAADPDGDGVPNWAEYRAGTDPTDVNSVLRLQTRLVTPSQNATSAPQVALHWSSIEGKRYVLEAAASLQNPSWTTVASDLIGNGADMEFIAPDTTTDPGKYYRLRVME